MLRLDLMLSSLLAVSVVIAPSCFTAKSPECNQPGITSLVQHLVSANDSCLAAGDLMCCLLYQNSMHLSTTFGRALALDMP